MHVSVFGLGYVGPVTAASLTELGCGMTGMCLHAAKVEAFNDGQSPLIKHKIDDLFKAATEQGLLFAITNALQAVAGTYVSIVCNGTLSMPSKKLNLWVIQNVWVQIAQCLLNMNMGHVIIFRSTLLAESKSGLVTAMFQDLGASGKVRFYYCPELLPEDSESVSMTADRKPARDLFKRQPLVTLILCDRSRQDSNHHPGS